MTAVKMRLRAFYPQRNFHLGAFNPKVILFHILLLNFANLMTHSNYFFMQNFCTLLVSKKVFSVYRVKVKHIIHLFFLLNKNLASKKKLRQSNEIPYSSYSLYE